jgi:hypothetical protein
MNSPTSHVMLPIFALGLVTGPSPSAYVAFSGTSLWPSGANQVPHGSVTRPNANPGVRRIREPLVRFATAGPATPVRGMSGCAGHG